MIPKTYHRAFMIGLVLLMAVIAMAPGKPANAAGINPVVMPPNSHPFGHTYGEWSNMWWQWAFSNPVIRGQEELNPLFDTTGAHCAAGQSGHVFFLAGIFTILSTDRPADGPIDRTQCVVPTGSALFFPILNAEEDNASTPNYTDEDIHTHLTSDLADIQQVSATIDGTPVRGLDNYFVNGQNPIFNANLPDNNLYQYYGVDVAPGMYRMGTGGYYLMLHPLSAGQHVIHFSGSTGAGFSLDITYHLTVAPGDQ